MPETTVRDRISPANNSRRINPMFKKSLASIVSAAVLVAGPGHLTLDAAAQTLTRGPVAGVSVTPVIGTGINSPVPGASSFNVPPLAPRAPIPPPPRPPPPPPPPPRGPPPPAPAGGGARKRPPPRRSEKTPGGRARQRPSRS